MRLVPSLSYSLSYSLSRFAAAAHIQQDADALAGADKDGAPAAAENGMARASDEGSQVTAAARALAQPKARSRSPG